MKRKTRDCVRTAPIDVLVVELSQGRRRFLIFGYGAGADHWNNWNFGTIGTCGSLKRFERSEAVERLERFERTIDLRSEAVERLERLERASFA